MKNPFKKEIILYDHQKEAVKKVQNNNFCGMLHHDVGCGKTISSFYLFKLLRDENPEIKMVVICPANILERRGWGEKIQEFTTWNYYNCRALKANYQNDNDEMDIYLVNYESLFGKKHKDRLTKLFNKFKFFCVLDESHRMKSHDKITAKILNGYYAGRKLIAGHRSRFPHRLLLTGTAAPNSQFEWYSQSLFISEEIFGRRVTNFRAKYFHLERKNWSGVKEILEVRGDYFNQMKKSFKLALIPQMRDEFYQKLEKYIHFAKKDECLDLPEQIDQIRLIGMSDEQRKLYNQMRDELVIEFSEIDEVIAEYALTKIQKLIQIANGFVIDNNKKVHIISDSKLKELETIAEELGDQQCIVWGYYVKEIELILERLGNKAIGFKGNDPDKVLSDFVSGKYQFLVANPYSRSEGLDLYNANVQIFCSLNHSLRLYEQARGRTHRIGQTKNCLYIHIVTEQSEEENIYLCLQGKKTEQEFAYEFVQRIKHSKQHKKHNQTKLQGSLLLQN